MRDTPSRLEQCVVKIIAQLVKARQAAGLPIDGDLDARIGDQLSWAISNIRIRLDPEQNLPPEKIKVKRDTEAKAKCLLATTAMTRRVVLDQVLAMATEEEQKQLGNLPYELLKRYEERQATQWRDLPPRGNKLHHFVASEAVNLWSTFARSPPPQWKCQRIAALLAEAATGNAVQTAALRPACKYLLERIAPSQLVQDDDARSCTSAV